MLLDPRRGRETALQAELQLTHLVPAQGLDALQRQQAQALNPVPALSAPAPLQQVVVVVVAEGVSSEVVWVVMAASRSVEAWVHLETQA